MDALANPRRTPIRYCVLAALIPVVYIFAYMSIGGIYPQWDPAQYMETGLGIYNAFADQGYAQGLKALYFHRGWRPTLTPVIIVPFYALTGGKALAAMHIVCPVLYGVFLLYVSLLLRTALQGIRLVFAVLFIGTNIPLVTIGLDFWSELPYGVASAAALFHFHKCNYFQNRRHSIAAGIALGLALCCRPIVGGGTFAAPLILYLYLSVKKKTISWRDVSPWLIYLVVSLTIVGGLSQIPGNKSWFRLGLLGFLVAAAVALAFANRGRFRLSANNLLVASAAFALPVWWFGLFAREVFGWTFANTFGDLARVHLTWLPHPRESPVTFLMSIAHSTVSVPGLIVLSVAAAAIVMRAIRQRKLPRPGSTTLLTGALFIVPLLGTLTTYNGDPRYLIFPAFILIMACTAWFLMGADSDASSVRRIGILTPALVLQVIFLGSKMAPLPDNIQGPLDRYLLSSIFPQPLPVWIDRQYPAKPVYERIVELVGKASTSRIGVIFPNGFFYLNLPAVNVIAAENKQELVVELASQHVPREPNRSDESRVQELGREFTHVLVGPLSVWQDVPDPIRSVGKYLIEQDTRYEKSRVVVPTLESDDVWEFVLVRIDSKTGVGPSRDHSHY